MHTYNWRFSWRILGKISRIDAMELSSLNLIHICSIFFPSLDNILWWQESSFIFFFYSYIKWWKNLSESKHRQIKFRALADLIGVILRCLQTPWEIGGHLRERWHPKVCIGSSGLHPGGQSGSPRVGEGHVPGWSWRSNESVQQRRWREPQKSSVHHLQCNWNLAFFLCDSRVV